MDSGSPVGVRNDKQEVILAHARILAGAKIVLRDEQRGTQVPLRSLSSLIVILAYARIHFDLEP